MRKIIFYCIVISIFFVGCSGYKSYPAKCYSRYSCSVVDLDGDKKEVFFKFLDNGPYSIAFEYGVNYYGFKYDVPKKYAFTVTGGRHYVNWIYMRDHGRKHKFLKYQKPINDFKIQIFYRDKACQAKMITLYKKDVAMIDKNKYEIDLNKYGIDIDTTQLKITIDWHTKVYNIDKICVKNR